MRIFISLILTALILHAQPAYPALYKELGTPLFKAMETFAKFESQSAVQAEISSYNEHAKNLLIDGKRADSSSEKKLKKEYLIALRSLQKEHDAILLALTKILKKSIAEHDYRQFSSLVKTEFEGYYKNPRLKEEILAYYLENRSKGRNPYLDQKVAEENSTNKIYAYKDPVHKSYDAVRDEPSPSPAAGEMDEKVILVTRTGCPYCTKAKNFLRSRGIAYTEYETGAGPEGRRLLRKYGATGVPLLISGNRIQKGYSDGSYIKFFGTR